MKIRLVSLFIFIYVVVSHHIMAQGIDSVYQNRVVERHVFFKPNIVFGSISYDFAFGAVDLSYEGMIWNSQKKYLTALSLKASGGFFAIWYIVNSQYNLSLVAYTGKGVNHFEYSLGASFFYDNWNYAGVLPTASLGYRYQKPEGKLVYRCGLGFPEVFYFGIGIGF